jgi:hypothetical protein
MSAAAMDYVTPRHSAPNGPAALDSAKAAHGLFSRGAGERPRDGASGGETQGPIFGKIRPSKPLADGPSPPRAPSLPTQASGASAFPTTSPEKGIYRGLGH